MTCPDVFSGARQQIHWASPVATLGSKFSFHGGNKERSSPEVSECPNFDLGWQSCAAETSSYKLHADFNTA